MSSAAELLSRLGVKLVGIPTESLLQDLRFTLRTLRRTPAFPVTAIATLAIGIAATTAIFSTVNAALLKPLPYPNSEEIGFGAAAIALAAIGIYGVIAYSAAQRRNEMAIRLALGATSQNVFWLTVRQGRTLALAGAAIGVLVAYLSGRLASNWLFEVRASDPFILGAATLLVIVIAVVATVIPAYRASRLEPARVLRPET